MTDPQQKAFKRWALVGLLCLFSGCIGTAYAQRARDDLIAFIKAGIGTHVTDTEPLPVTFVSAGATQVEGTTADGAAFSDNPVIGGGVDSGGDAQQFEIDGSNGLLVSLATNITAASGDTITTFPTQATTVVNFTVSCVSGAGGTAFPSNAIAAGRSFSIQIPDGAPDVVHIGPTGSPTSSDVFLMDG